VYQASGEKGQHVRLLKQGLSASILAWLPLATLAVLIAGMVYVAVQQDYRGTANDPQIQMATDARNALEAGASAETLLPPNKIDIARSLAPYLVIYGANTQPVASSATLRGQPILPPAGVFASAERSPMNVVTWMPEPGVRSAIVVMRYSDGYVLAGRSLQQIEDRESNLGLIVGAACVATLGLTFLAVVATQLLTLRFLPGAVRPA